MSGLSDVQKTGMRVLKNVTRLPGGSTVIAEKAVLALPRRRRWVSLVAALVVMVVTFASRKVEAQPFLPPPFTTPVMDVLRREAAAAYSDMREEEFYQKTLERIYDEMAGLGITEYNWRSIVGTLDDVEGVLASGASLGYRAGGLLDRIDRLFRITEGYSPYTDQAGRWEAILETYKTMAETGLYFADDLEKTSETVGSIKAQIENIGQGFFGLVELGSHQESAQAESQAAIMAAEEMVQMRASIAMQTNADIVAAMERIAQDRLVEVLVRCHITGAGCPHEETWKDDWDWTGWGPGDDEGGDDGGGGEDE